jgi:hypothetical protein
VSDARIPPLFSMLLSMTLAMATPGCLYTRSQVQEKFKVQALETVPAAISLVNESAPALQICSFGDTADGSYCNERVTLGTGETSELGYQVARIEKPVAGAGCSFDECLTVDLTDDQHDLLAGNTPLVLIDDQRGLSISVRPAGDENAVGTEVSVTNDVRRGPGCFTVTFLSKDAATDGSATSLFDENADEWAQVTTRAADCGR